MSYVHQKSEMASSEPQPRLIQRILPYKIQINNSIRHHNFFKKGYISPQILDVEYLSINHYSNSRGRYLMKDRILKLLRRAKPVKALHLHKCLVHYEDIPDQVLIQIAKKTSNVKSLSLPYYTISQEIIRKYSLWLQHTRRLKRFGFISPATTDFPDSNLANFQSAMRKFSHAIKRNRIEVLNISHTICDDRIGVHFTKFREYPANLKQFSFAWNHFSTEITSHLQKVKPSLCHMKNLEALALSFRNQTDLLVSALNSISNLTKITSLNIGLFNPPGENQILPFHKLRGFNRLSKLKLKFDFWPKGLEYFLKLISNCPLRSFSLDIVIDHDGQLVGLKELVNRARDLKNLSLKIYKLSLFETREYLKHLFEKISHLKALKNLELSLMSFGSNEKQNMLSQLVPGLKGLFTKTIKIQHFSFKSNQIDAREGFLQLMNLIHPSASCLRKLKIDVGKFQPQESSYKKVINLVSELKNVQELELKGLSVSMDQLTQKFLDTVYDLRHLEKFQMSEIRFMLDNQPIAIVIEKVLSKRGLKKFECNISFDYPESFVRRNRVFSVIDLKSVIRRNPCLERYPRSTVLFTRYTDDTEWEWGN